MHFKKRFLLLLFLMITLRGMAQETIIQELAADNYINKLVDTAIKNYPRLRTYQNRIDASNANVSKIKASWLDALTVSYIYQPGTTTIDPVNPQTSYFKGLQAGVFLNVGTLVGKPSQVRQAKLETAVIRSELDEYRVTIRTEVRKRYYLYLQRVAELKLQIRATTETGNSLKDFKYKFEKGEETFDSYNKVQIQYS